MMSNARTFHDLQAMLTAAIERIEPAALHALKPSSLPTSFSSCALVAYSAIAERRIGEPDSFLPVIAYRMDDSGYHWRTVPFGNAGISRIEDAMEKARAIAVESASQLARYKADRCNPPNVDEIIAAQRSEIEAENSGHMATGRAANVRTVVKPEYLALWEAYARELHAEMVKSPAQYMGAPHEAGRLAWRIVCGLYRGTASKDSKPLARACRKLGIKHTYKAIRAYLGSEYRFKNV